MRSWRFPVSPRALRASRIRPLEALRQASTSADRPSLVVSVLGLLALAAVAFVEDFLEDAARPARVAHVDIGPREIQLGAHLGHGARVMQIVRYLVGAERLRLRHIIIQLADVQVDVLIRADTGLFDRRLVTHPRRLVAPRAEPLWRAPASA